MAAGRGIVLFTTAALASIALAPHASAKTFVVTKLGDPQPNGCTRPDCSLREAVIAANDRPGADRVELPTAKTYTLGIENSAPSGEDAAAEGDLDITDTLRVGHPGKGRATVDAERVDRVFDVLAAAQFADLVITRGFAEEEFGGGIRAVADVTILRSVVTKNRTGDADGGGIGFPDVEGSLTVSRSVVSRNVSRDDGGGVSFDTEGPGEFRVDRSRFSGNRSQDWGGGFITAKTANITKSTFADNVSVSGNGGGGAIELPDGSQVFDSTFSGNEADGGGGGLSVTDGSDVILENVTIADNTAAQGGGLLAGEASLNAVSIVRNDADLGGGLFGAPAGGVSVENSLLALNDAQTSGDDCIGDEPFNSLGHNLLSTAADCLGFEVEGDIVEPNPRIGALSRNGGPTRTVPLRSGSPAIGAANALTAPGTDQRGENRDGSPDVGAFERTG